MDNRLMKFLIIAGIVIAMVIVGGFLLKILNPLAKMAITLACLILISRVMKLRFGFIGILVWIIGGFLLWKLAGFLLGLAGILLWVCLVVGILYVIYQASKKWL
jgi:hypothetical protein